MLHTEKLIRLMNADKIFLSLSACEVCGSRQRYHRSDECFGCAVEMELGLSFNVVCAQAWSDNVTGSNQRYISLGDYHHSKRQGTVSQSIARNLSRDLYYGEACGRCGCNLRRVSNGHCEGCLTISIRYRCDRGERLEISAGRGRKMVAGKFFPILTMHVDRIVRDAAKELGERKYVGYPCDCGSTQRYTLRGQCTSCVTDRNKKKPAPARTEAGDYDRLFE